MTVRKTFYWFHLSLGLVAGLFIGLMALTGAALSFEKELINWAERDTLQVAQPGPEAARLDLGELIQRLRTEKPGVEIGAVTVYSDPNSAVVVNTGRNSPPLGIDPWTGKILEGSSHRMRDTLHAAEELHRWLALGGTGRDTGKLITGSACLLFFLLCLSGLWLWFPKQWTREQFRRRSLLQPRATGRARDWNWHNVFGFWTLPILLVITGTGLVMAFPWADALVWRAAGEQPPQRQEGRREGQGQKGGDRRQPAPSQADIAWQAVLDGARAARPGWESIGIRPMGTQPAQLLVHSRGDRPRFGSDSLRSDPKDGHVISAQAYADNTPGRRLRNWMRYLHTGEGLGLPGKSLALLGAFSTLLLVVTGFMLFFRAKPKRTA